jgi:hypothetical protein
VPITIEVPVATTVTAAKTTMTYGEGGSVAVTVTPGTASGTVQLLDGDTLVGEATVTDGQAEVVVDGTALEPDAYLLDLVFIGGAGFADSLGTAAVKVNQATPTVTVTADSTRLRVKKGSAMLSIDVTASGFTPTGPVAIYVDGSLVGSEDLGRRRDRGGRTVPHRGRSHGHRGLPRGRPRPPGDLRPADAQRGEKV